LVAELLEEIQPESPALSVRAVVALVVRRYRWFYAGQE